MSQHLIYKRLPLSRISPDPESVHSKYSLPEDDSGLRASIQEFGVMSGLIVCAAAKGRYFIIDGERRYLIAKELRLRDVDCTILPAMNPGERERLRFELYMTYKPLTQKERSRQRRRLRQLGVKLPTLPQ